MAQNILNERFKGPALDARLQWLNPPPAWSLEPARLMVRPAADTDFWQETHYGFRADNGHFLYLKVAGDFEIEEVPVVRAKSVVRLLPEVGIRSRSNHQSRRFQAPRRGRIQPLQPRIQCRPFESLIQDILCHAGVFPSIGCDDFGDYVP